MKWRLTGTAQQIDLARMGMELIKFPFEQLKTPPTGDPELGWRDLNSGMFRMHDDHTHTTEGTEGHGTEDEPEPLLGSLDGRRFVMGVFYPYSARIYIDQRLVNYPDLAISTLSAEIGHAVDEFLPLTEEQRNAIIADVGGVFGVDTWWEKQDYSAEYYSLIGETFMILFTKAYTDVEFGDTTDFVFEGENTTAEEIRNIIGIQRTDWTPPQPIGVVYPKAKSKIYHHPDHYPKKVGTEIFDSAGLTKCKTCVKRKLL